MSASDGGIGENREFPSTSWSLILGAQSASADYGRHMTRLAEIYWRPVYSFIRHAWRKGHEDARDLTQEFFASVVIERKLLDGYAREAGGFRSFVRVAISRFMVNADERATSLKRGGGQTIASLEALGPLAFESLDPEAGRSPEQLFDIAWREAVIVEAMDLLRQRMTADGRAAEFEVFRRYDYDQDSAEISYAELGQQVGLSEQQVNSALRMARKGFRKVVAGIVSGYVASPADLEAELRMLFGG